MSPGWIVILNGVPRSGKTSIARAMQEIAAEPWINLGVDAAAKTLPKRAWPGIGLRPGGERPDLEPLVSTLYCALFDSIAAHSRQGINVVSDLGLHDSYSQPLAALESAVQTLAGLPVLFVGIRCPLDEIMRRRNDEPEGSMYARSESVEDIPEPVRRWQIEVHRDKAYDLELDTSHMSPEDSANAIFAALSTPPNPLAFDRM